MNKSWILPVSLLCIAVFLVFVQAGAPSLDSDGIHYAAVAREIARSNRWLLPFDPIMNGPHYWHFPLTIWATASFFQWFGVSAFIAKLYSMIMIFVAVEGLYALGTLLAGPWTGWFAGLSFLLTNHVLRIARQCRPDLPLIAYLVWAFYGLARAQTGSKFWYLLTGAATLAAVMTKEFVGLVPLVAGTMYLLLRRQWRDLVHPAFLGAWAIALGPVFGWMALEKAVYGDTLWRNYHALNFSHLLQNNPLGTPWYYYAWAVWDKYWYFLPFAAAGGWIAFQKIRKGQDPRWLLIFLWAAAFPVGFSLARHKVHYYILPSYAAAALWVGLFCDRWFPARWRMRFLQGAVVLTMAVVTILAFSPVNVRRIRYAENLRFIPKVDSVIAQAPGDMIVAGADGASVLFYSQVITRLRQAHNPEEFRPLMSNPAGNRRYCLMTRENWKLLDAEARARWTILEESEKQLFLRQEAAGGQEVALQNPAGS